jgi:hypothetical protein
MAKGKKTGGKNFALGNKANPKGGGAISPETRIIRKITTENLKEIADVILDGNIEKLKEIITDPNSSVLKVWLAKAAATAIQKGDLGPLDTILNRSIGKVKDNINHSTSDGFKILIEDYKGKK